MFGKIDTSFDRNAHPARVFLDMPFRYGAAHLKKAFSSSEKVNTLRDQAIKIEPDSKGERCCNLEWRTRILHGIIGFAECIPVVGIIVLLVEKYFIEKAKLISTDEHKLIKAQQPFPKHEYQWYLNLGLLRQAYELADNEEDRKTIRFLAANFLNKVTPKQMNVMEWSDPDYKTKHQGSPFNEYRYHRECLEEGASYGREFNQKLTYGEETRFILTENIDIAHLFPLKFTTIKDKNYKEAILKFLNGSNPILLDVTNMIGASIETDHDGFKREFEAIKREFEKQRDEAIDEFIKGKADQNRDELKARVDKNVTAISRVEMDGAKGIKVLPMGEHEHSPLIPFMINRGLYIGAINLRRRVFDVFQQRDDVVYSPKPNKNGEKPIFLNKKDFEWILKRERFEKDKPHIQVLGRGTLDLLRGVMKEISDDKWNQLMQHPAFSKILDASLESIRTHLGLAEFHRHNFNKFTDEIELVHEHLAVILELFRPFQESDFGPIYQEKLTGKSVPEGLNVKAGLAKTAVNLFTAIAHASKKGDAPLRGVQSQGSYFEQAMLMDHAFDHYMKNKELPPVDLYVGQFNSNVDVGSELTHYERRDIIKDVRALLDNGRTADPFTVAVDLTIEEFDSTNTYELLKAFEKEIKDGTLNFVFFASGQKFYNFGMDNYYGSYFYVVNNGAPKWDSFKSLFEHPAHRPDILSAQWFCLATKYAADSLARYRKLIFDNSRAVLDAMPDALKPRKDSKIRVGTADRDMSLSFIDIKVVAPSDKQDKKCQPIKKKFYEVMNKHKVNVYGRGSFGFYYTNFAIFGPLDDKVREIRINPGINPDENEALIEFFKAISA